MQQINTKVKKGGNSIDIHRACRRFEFGIHGAETEQLQTMYQEETYGSSKRRTLSRAVPLDMYDESDSNVVARYILRDRKIVVEKT